MLYLNISLFVLNITKLFLNSKMIQYFELKALREREREIEIQTKNLRNIHE